MYICPVCYEYKHEKLISLSLHYRKKHKKTAKELYDKEKMCDIIRSIAIGLGWNSGISKQGEMEPELQRLKHKIANAVADYHIQNNISGIVLCEKCHKNIHNSLNF